MKRRALVAISLILGAAAAAAWQLAEPSRPKVVVIGLDGATWTFLDPLVNAHQLPHIEGVLRGATRGELETFRPTHSAILWTSVATGKTMEKHGITDWTFVDEDAKQEIERLRVVTGTRRVAATIWEILSEKGYSVGVVNWWVTYPARPVNGVVVTDRLKVVMNRRSVPDEPDVVYPPSLVEELRPFFLRPGDLGPILARFDFPPFSRRDADEMFQASPASRHLHASLLSYVGQDEMVVDWAIHLLRKGQPDFFAVVLRLTDVFAHFGWRFADRATLERIVPQIEIEQLTSDEPSVRARAQALVAELDRAVAQAMLPAYKFADRFVGKVVATIDPDSLVVLVSDHGQVWRGATYDHNPTSHGDYPPVSPPGVLVVKGNGIREATIEGATLFDITPTLLYALGEPIARDMDGSALSGIFRGSPLFGTREERFVLSYGTGAAQVEDTAPTDEAEREILDDLRSLGYIGGPEPRHEEQGADPETRPKR